MDPNINWRDVLSVGAAILSVFASGVRLWDRWQERRDKRRRAEDHRRAVEAIAPPDEPDPAPDSDPDGPPRPDDDHDHDDDRDDDDRDDDEGDTQG